MIVATGRPMGLQTCRPSGPCGDCVSSPFPLRDAARPGPPSKDWAMAIQYRAQRHFFVHWGEQDARTLLYKSDKLTESEAAIVCESLTGYERRGPDERFAIECVSAASNTPFFLELQH